MELLKSPVKPTLLRGFCFISEKAASGGLFGPDYQTAIAEKEVKQVQKILVVDDVEINREILNDMLKGSYIVETAADGEQAVRKLQECEGKLAALLLDLQMPNMDGYGVLEWMKKNQWMEKIPVLVISGEDSAKIENYCLEMGVLDFIHKPFEGSIVKNRVKNIVELFSCKNILEQKVESQTKVLEEQGRIKN